MGCFGRFIYIFSVACRNAGKNLTGGRVFDINEFS